MVVYGFLHIPTHQPPSPHQGVRGGGGVSGNTLHSYINSVVLEYIWCSGGLTTVVNGSLNNILTPPLYPHTRGGRQTTCIYLKAGMNPGFWWILDGLLYISKTIDQSNIKVYIY